MEDNNRNATEFDNLVDKVNEHIVIYGNLDLLSDYERGKVKEWQIPVMESIYNIKHKSSFGGILTQDEFEKARADEWYTTMVFGVGGDPFIENK